MNNGLQVSDALVRALGWALAHSLWQALVAALLLLVLMPRLQTARQRYWAAYAALVAVFATAIATFIWLYEPGQHLEGASAGPLEWSPGTAYFFVEQQTFGSGLWQICSTWLETNHAIIVTVWLMGFVFFLLRLGGGLWQVHRLRTQGVRAPEIEWLEKFNTLRQQLGFSRAVSLLESALVQTPMAIGWLKPVILLPFGLVNRLSLAEVEAVLAHELAHIARRDWIFNLLQAFIESLFYFHPAVWWISAIVRRERENCCDDAALAATGNPLAFAKALVQVQEMAVPVPIPALGLSGPRRRPLLNRVRRILNQPQQRQHQVMEKITATIILLALLVLVGLKANSVPTLEAAFAQITTIPTTLFSDQTPKNQMVSDTVPKPKSTRKITREDDNQRVEAEYKDGKLTRLNIDGKEIPEAEFEQHEALVKELEADVETPPAPPTPPTAPGFWGTPRPEIWEMREAPEPPEAPEAPEPPEVAEMPFMPFGGGHGGPIRVVSDKDSEGNTIIRLDNNGDATEVIVKNGDVYVNGKKLEKGESLDIPGMSFGGDGQGYFFNNGAGNGFSYDYAPAIAGHEMEFSQATAEEKAMLIDRLNKERNEELARSMKDREKEMTQRKLDYEREMKQAQKELKRSQKEWSSGQKDWEKDQKKWAEDQEKWKANQDKWQAEQRAWEIKNRAMNSALKQELLKDGLISDGENFSLELSDKLLKVNKKKQSEEMHKKYLELMEKMSGQKMNGDSSFLYNISDDK